MKSYTDLEQSKKLSEFLPIESSDMFCADVFDKEKESHSYNFHILSTWGCNTFEELKDRENKLVHFIPCWSLAALLNVLPDTITSNDGIAFKLNVKKNIIEYSNPSLYLIYKSVKSDNIVDACYEMTIKLHEQKLL